MEGNYSNIKRYKGGAVLVGDMELDSSWNFWLWANFLISVTETNVQMSYNEAIANIALLIKYHLVSFEAFRNNVITSIFHLESLVFQNILITA
jgi:hypothetical protein